MEGRIQTVRHRARGASQKSIVAGFEIASFGAVEHRRHPDAVRTRCWIRDVTCGHRW